MNEKVTLSMEDIMIRLKSFSFPEVDLVVGITTGASFPAQKIADLLNLPVQYIQINYRHPDNTPKYANPKLIKMVNII